MATPRGGDPTERRLGLIGLALRSGRLAIGVDATRAGLQRRAIAVVVLADDASPRAVEKVVRLAEATGIPVLGGPAADRIGARLGRPPVMAVGVRDRGIAAGLVAVDDARDGA